MVAGLENPSEPGGLLSQEPGGVRKAGMEVADRCGGRAVAWKEGGKELSADVVSAHEACWHRLQLDSVRFPAPSPRSAGKSSAPQASDFGVKAM